MTRMSVILSTLFLSCFFCLNAAFAAELEVSAKGKDLPTAELNAKVNAVRERMHALIGPVLAGPGRGF
ncbi:hypothetical protein LJC36_04160 [Desulfovibrio sp. OttesenSCG-928-C14]|nr:hypothetical protein [Desulfovibrio sp. OttesenSCG-928-C14]